MQECIQMANFTDRRSQRETNYQQPTNETYSSLTEAVIRPSYLAFQTIWVHCRDDEIGQKIFDLNGRVLLKKRIENSRSPLLRNIDLSNLPKGLYFVKLTNFQSEISTKFLLI